MLHFENAVKFMVKFLVFLDALKLFLPLLGLCPGVKMGNLLKCMTSDEKVIHPVHQHRKQEPVDTTPSFPSIHGDSIVNSVVSTNQNWLSVSGGEDGHVVLFDWRTGEALQRWTEHKRAVNRLAYGARVDAIFSGSRDGSVLMWRAGSPASVQRFLGHELTVNGVAACAPDDRLLFSGSRDWTVRLGKECA